MGRLYRQCKIKYKNCKCYLKYVEIKDKVLQFLQFKCLKCNYNHEKGLMKT